LRALIDSAANQRTLNGVKSVAELFYECGIAADTDVNKDVFYGINKVKSMLRPLNSPPKLYVFKNCVNMIREFKGYSWGGGDSPVKKDDHAMDELRYYVCKTDDPKPVKIEKTVIEKDKERLAKKLNAARYKGDIKF